MSYLLLDQDMQDLEQLIQQQNGLLDKLRGECRTLTDKLEETSKQYKYVYYSLKYIYLDINNISKPDTCAIIF